MFYNDNEPTILLYRSHRCLGLGICKNLFRLTIDIIHWYIYRDYTCNHGKFTVYIQLRI